MTDPFVGQLTFIGNVTKRQRSTLYLISFTLQTTKITEILVYSRHSLHKTK